MTKRSFIIFNFLLVSALANAQDYAMGLLLNDSLAAQMPKKATLLTRGYEGLPSSYSLQKYCPTPINQGSYSTCVAWSSAYAARTMAEAIAYGWTERAQIDKEAFSPWFLYGKIKYGHDYDCDYGTHVEYAVKYMKEHGVVKKSDYFVECASLIPPELDFKASKYKITSYTVLYHNTTYGSMPASNLDLNKVKMAISNNHPVVISAYCYKSLSSAGDKWNGVHDVFRGNHAMCVVAYDDNKYGGAFLIQNSWGTDWGTGGFSWFTYNDFASIVYDAMEIYVKPKNFVVDPNHPTKANSLSGSLKLQLSTGEEMRGTLGTNGVYKISGEYISGTRYRIYISNNEPAYVYVIGSDLQNNVSKVFPPNDRISPALTYKSNNIAIPDENWFVQMDNTVGKDYVCVLYSAQELDINTIINKIRSGYGSFPEKVSAALSGKIVPASDVRFSQNSLSFSASTNKSVVALIAEVVHK